jgi:starvation-inducible DNA-binding protein
MSLVSSLHALLSSEYALFLKTQTYHWNVTGPEFPALHALFETQYTALLPLVDGVAEAIRSLGSKVPAGLAVFQKESVIKDGNENAKARDMVLSLAADHRSVIELASKARALAETEGKIITVAFLDGVLEQHNQFAWMLEATGA